MKRLLVSASSAVSVIAVILWQSAAFAAITVNEYNVSGTTPQPEGLAAGPDGNMWFVEHNGNNVDKVNTSGTITSYPIPTSNSQPYYVAKGPDGNMWFTECSGNKIGKITTSGTITEYTDPTSADCPFDITQGPDGNMWFTSNAHINKVTTSGVITQYADSFASPWEVTTGSDGNLWFTQNGGNNIAEMAPTGGAITQHAVPTSASVPFGITSGPDGNIWFTERDGNKVGKLTTSGTFTEYPMTTSSAKPFDITTGPDNNLWFVENQGNKVGRITTSGTVTEYSIPTSSSSPNTIAFGTDSSIWFDEVGVGKIGRIPLPKPAASAQTVSAVAGKSVTIDTLSGATNNPDPSTVTIDSGPSHGVATINHTTGAITYTPNTGYAGTDSLSFIVCSLDDAQLCSPDPVLTFNVSSGSTPDTGYGKIPTNRMRIAAFAASSLLLIGAGLALRKKYSRS